MKIKFNFATGSDKTSVYSVLVDDAMFGILVIRKQEENTTWSIFDREGTLFEWGISEEYYLCDMGVEIQKILETALKEEYDYE